LYSNRNLIKLLTYIFSKKRKIALEGLIQLLYKIFIRNTMAQISIREYDVKKMFYDFSWEKYTGIQIRTLEDIEKLSEWIKYTIKPDMLFWKRGKRWLLGLNLNKAECKIWLKKYFKKQENIDGIDGTLDVFMAEKFIWVSQEYYICFSQSRTGDLITYSPEGWVDIEDNWEKTFELTIPISGELSEENIQKLNIWENGISELIKRFWVFYKSHWFVSLECNPIARDASGKLIMLDAVAKVDDQEAYLQKENWENMEIPNSYGFQENAGEQYIRELDGQTWASLKMKILNPQARIWTLFAGGGGSLVMTDTLGALGYADDIWNYGECSGNPTREFTREYTKTLLSEMLRNWKSWKYLVIAGAIANFTHIDKTFQWIIDALEENIDEILSQKISILVRRGWINEKAWLKILEDACKKLGIPAIITGSDSYMTEILKEIKL